MIKISNREIIDVVRFSDDKAIFVEKRPNIDATTYNVNYFLLNFSTGEKDIITKDAYLLKKYGANRKLLCEKLGNFVIPDAYMFSDRQVLVIYPTGQTGLFDKEGNLIRDGVLSYNDNEVSGIAEDGDFFWSVCQKENAVIRYYADGVKVDIRIGGKDQPTFDNPHFVSSDEENVYVCCNHNKVRVIDKSTFTVSDLPKMYNNITGYYKFGNCAIITTYDCAYCDKD